MIKLDKSLLLSKNKNKIKDKKVLVRVDYNVEIKNGKILDDYRIKESLKTIKFLKENKAKQIILITHFGRPKNQEKICSTKNLIPFLKKYIKNIEYFYWKPGLSLPNNQIVLLENIRFFEEEEKNDYKFAKELSKLGDIYVNEAFSVSHRKHASLHRISKILPTYFGFNFEKEINNLNLVFEYIKKKKEVGVVIGGAKIETKIEVIEKYIKKAEIIILVGGIANTFLKGKGFNIGNSLYDEEYLNYVKKIYSPKILLPFDFITQNGHKYLGEIQKDDVVYDIGEESIKIFLNELKRMKLVVWNGPLGKIEEKKYEKGSLEFAKGLIKMKNKKIIGGGETLAIANKVVKKDKNTFISTGGGAMLYYLANEKLPIFD